MTAPSWYPLSVKTIADTYCVMSATGEVFTSTVSADRAALIVLMANEGVRRDFEHASDAFKE